MNTFTEYQLRRYRFIFAQYSEDSWLEPVVRPHSNLSTPSHLTISAEFDHQSRDLTSQSLSLKVCNGATIEHAPNSTYRLKSKDLHSLLPRFGPPLSPQVVKELIYSYDSSCTYSLDFEDFIEFLADYKVTLDIKREAAQMLFAKKSYIIDDKVSIRNVHHGRVREIAESVGFKIDDSTSSSFLLSALQRATTLADFLSFLNLDDSECLWASQDPIIQAISETDLVTDYIVLKRDIAVRIVEASGLESFSRTKLRPGRGIDFHTLDPFVRVTIGGLQKQTSAIVGTLNPLWDQELMFPVLIPPGEVIDVVNWVMGHAMVVELMDLHTTGNVSHGEVLAIGSVPLIRIFTTTKKPFELAVPLRSLDGVDRHIEIDLHATDQTQEKGSFTKVLDASLRPEFYWRRLYPEKMKRDLCPGANVTQVNRKSPTLKLLDADMHEEHEARTNEQFKRHVQSVEKGGRNPDFWNYYINVIDTISQIFPRRTFAVLGLDECTKFRPLPSFIRPIRLERPLGVSQKYTRHELAQFVSGIPFYSAMSAFSDMTHRQLSKLPASVANKLFHETVPLSEAFLYPVTYSESLFTPVTTPGSLVSRGFGGVMDHAILLCSLFLGAGHDAYVAVGTTAYKHSVWVITIDKRGTCPDVEISIQTPDLRHSGNSWNSMDADAFKLRDKLDNAKRVNSRLVVQHWDVTCARLWKSPHEAAFPFERVACLFNHQNVWFNVQQSDCIARPVLTWDLSNVNTWLPFISSRLMSDYTDVMQCFYTTHTVLHDATLSFDNNDAKLRSQVVDLIRTYRKTQLLTTTQFHRPLSRWLQLLIPTFEDSLRSEHDVYHKPDHLSTSIINAPGSFVPKHTIYYQRYLLLCGKVPAISVLHHLVRLGLIDCTVHGCAFTIAAESFVYPLGTRRTWIGIGVLIPIY